MDKKKLKTKDGSEFTVFYLKTEPKWGKDKFGHNADENKYYLTPEEAEPIVQDNYASWEIKEAGLWDIYGHLYKDQEKSLEGDFFDFPFPSFGLPFSKKEEVVIDDRIESDAVLTPLKGCVYRYSQDMRLYRYVSEKMVDQEPLWELADNKKNIYLVPAEDCYLYAVNQNELDEFLRKETG